MFQSIFQMIFQSMFQSMFQYNDVFAELTLVTLVIRVILDGIRHYLLNDFPDVPWCKYNDDTVSSFDANDLPGVSLCVAVCLPLHQD